MGPLDPHCPARGRGGARLTLLIISTALLAVLVIACRPASSLPVLFPAPEWSLTDQTGRPFSSSNLSGRVVLADFVYTTCTDICPLLSGTLSEVRNQLRQAKLLGEKAVLLSFSVDPDHDTPQVLDEYGKRFGAVPSEWRFLTGDRESVEELLLGRLQAGPAATGSAASRWQHRDRPLQSRRPDRRTRPGTGAV